MQPFLRGDSLRRWSPSEGPSDYHLGKTPFHVRGPLLLEANARPGLAIQIANGIGLAQRLAEIDRDIVACGVALAPK